MIAALLALLLQATPAETPASRPVVLVVPPQAASESAWISEAVADAVPATLAELGVEAVSRADRLHAHEVLEIPPVDLSRATLIRIAEALGANRVVLGTAETAADTTSLALRVLDVERGTLSAPLLASGRTAELREVVDGLAFDLALALSAQPSRTRDELRARHATVSREAWETHAKGLAARSSVERVRHARRAVEQAPSFDAARVALASLLLEAREFSAAHDVLARVPADSPHARAARFLMGVSLLEVGRYRDAGALFAALVAEKPTSAALNNQAIALLRGGRTSSVTATELMRRAVDLGPGQASLAFNLGWAFLHEQQPLAAEFWLRGVLAQEPLNGAARVALAWALRQAGQAAKADEEWKGVVAIAPDWQGLRTPDLNRRFERVLTSERLLAIGGEARSDAEVAATLAARGERLFEAGDLPAALRDLNRAAYLDPYKPRIHAALGRVLRARGEREKAENEFRMALWSQDDVQVRLELATLLQAMGKKDEARREAERVLKADPTNAAAQAMVAGR